jgi:hypothetical protein
VRARARAVVVMAEKVVMIIRRQGDE